MWAANGTTVNGIPLEGRGTLAAGDVVQLGRTEIIVLGAPAKDAKDQAKHGPKAEHDPTSIIRFGQAAPAPPPPPPPQLTRSPTLKLAERVLNIDPTGTRELFPAYMDLPAHVPLIVWQVIRAGSVVGYLAVVVALLVRPAGGLFVFFRVIVPLWPVLFFVAPGVWRNICPLAASNQIPRVAGFSRAGSAPGWLARNGFLIAATLFFGIAGARIAGLDRNDRNGPAMAIVLTLIIASAFTGGVLLKGKSGWCSSVCPLLPLQRAYGQTPFCHLTQLPLPSLCGLHQELL
jgi:hypothetical protein